MPGKITVLTVLTAFVMVFLFTGCGIKGPPRPPEPQKMLATDAGR